MNDCDHPADAILADLDTGCIQCHRCRHVFGWVSQEHERQAMRTSVTDLERP